MAAVMYLLNSRDRRNLMTIPQKPFVAVRFDLPIKHHEKLRHLSISEHRPASELLVDAVELLLRYHGDGHGIPAPPRRTPPVEADVQETEVEVEVELEGSSS